MTDETGEIRGGRTGQAIIEFSLCFLLFISIVLATGSFCFWIFAKATLRHAVRGGVRFAITGQTLNGPLGPLGQDEVIKDAVVANAWPFLADASDRAAIKIEYFLADGTPTNNNAARNVVVVSVEDYQVPLMVAAPIFPLPNLVSFNVSAVDKVEPFPGAPPLRVVPPPP